MIGITLLLLPTLSLGEILLPFENSLPCLINPVAQVNAGDKLDFQYVSILKTLGAMLIGLYRLFNSRNASYEATLNFADPTFLPLTIMVTPHNCSGDQTASFKIPQSAPNGTAALQ